MKGIPEIEFREVMIPKGFYPRYFEIVGDKLQIYMTRQKKLKPMKFLL